MKRSIATAVLAVFCTIALAGASVARPGADGVEKGAGFVEEVDLVQGTLTVASQKMTVDEHATITDEKGNALSLEELQAAKPGPMPGLFEVDDADRIAFHAARQGRGWRLVSAVRVARGVE
ncbi:MAG: hypothetical protein R3E88_06430 [Myxococcota bacterium]|nr:hypothetical protein [Myxococcales bacterium]